MPVAQLSTKQHHVAVRLTDKAGNTTNPGDPAAPAIVDFEVAGVYRPQVANDLVSLRAYLEDLLEFSNNHVVVGPMASSTQVDTAKLMQIFYQPFELLADARVRLGQQPVNQLRAAIEILRRYNADLRSGVSTPTALVAYWPFDKGGGTEALDASGHHYDAVLSDDHMWAAGRAGFTLEFKFNEVTHSSVKVPIKPELDALTNDFTIAFWAKPTPDVTIEIQTEGTSGSDGIQGQHYVWGPKQGMIRRGQPSTAGVGISLGANGIAVYEYSVDFTGGIGSSAPVVLPPLLVYTPPSSQFSTWMHVALVYRQGQPSLYLDGKLIKTGLKSLRALVHASPEAIGGNKWGYYVGLLDEVRIFEGGLSDAEVAMLASVRVPAGPPPGSSQTESDYCQKAYEAILSRIGTSYEEIRLVRGATAEARDALSERLGITEDSISPQLLKALCLEPDKATETDLEQLFGVADTHRDPSTVVVPDPKFPKWQRDHLPRDVEK